MHSSPLVELLIRRITSNALGYGLLVDELMLVVGGFDDFGEVYALLEVDADEVVEVAVEDAADVGDLEVGAVVADHLVGVHNVGSDLVAELGGTVFALELGHVTATLLLLEVGEAGVEDAHRDVLVLELGAFVLDRYGDVGGQVLEPDGGGVLLDVLAAVPAGTEEVELDVVGVDLDLGDVLDFGQDLDQREAGMAQVGGVEGRQTDEAVDATLA